MNSSRYTYIGIGIGIGIAFAWQKPHKEPSQTNFRQSRPAKASPPTQHLCSPIRTTSSNAS